ncbi:MAG: Arm DNA-binding domain-containing protein [Sulfuritalea sp.]|nr:Arm DNA-binding domain-containing protein [Sulfuritalea sp.]
MRGFLFLERYYIGGKQKELTLGRYPDMSLAKAREIAGAKRIEIDQGINVAAEKQKGKAGFSVVFRLEQLAREVERARQYLERVEAAAEIARARLDVAERALEIERELEAKHGQIDWNSE